MWGPTITVIVRVGQCRVEQIPARRCVQLPEVYFGCGATIWCVAMTLVIWGMEGAVGMDRGVCSVVSA